MKKEDLLKAIERLYHSNYNKDYTRKQAKQELEDAIDLLFSLLENQNKEQENN